MLGHKTVLPEIIGVGLIVKLNDCGCPKQVPITGVTVITLEIGDAEVFTGVKELISPVPEEARPIVEFEFVQLYVDPAVPEKITVLVDTPEQTV